MQHSHSGSFRERAGFLRRQFLQDGDLPFTSVLSEEVPAQALAAITGWLDRIFSPIVTLWVFLGQVLSADHSCRAAVARLIALRLERGPTGVLLKVSELREVGSRPTRQDAGAAILGATQAGRSVCP